MEKNENQEELDAELDAEAKAIQDRYKEWVINKVLVHYKVVRVNLYFTIESPSLMADKTAIFFTLVDTDSGTEFFVVGDLDKHGEIIKYRVGPLKE